MKSARLLLGGIGLVLLVIGALIPLAAALRYLFVAATYLGHLITIPRFIVLRNAVAAVPDALLTGAGCSIVGLTGLLWPIRTDEGRACSVELTYQSSLTLATAQAALRSSLIFGGSSLLLALVARLLRCKATTR